MFIKIKNASSNWTDFPDRIKDINEVKSYITRNYKNYKGLKIEAEGSRLYVYFFIPNKYGDYNAYAVYRKCADIDLKKD